MDKTLLALGIAAVAAVSALPSAANARTKTVSIDGYCNVEIITLNHVGDPSSIRETGDGCDENIGVGGFKVRVKDQGKTAGFSWNSSGSAGTTIDLVFSNPYTTGSTVTLYYTVDGVTQQSVQATYTVLDGATQRSPKAGTRSITSQIRRP